MLAIAFERLVQAENSGSAKTSRPRQSRRGWIGFKHEEGQQLDIEFEDRLNVSEDDYLEMIEGKTAVMFWICRD